MRVLGIVSLFIFSYQLQAADTLVEARVHYGIDITNKSNIDNQVGSQLDTRSPSKPHHGFGGDAFVTLPVLPELGLGLRYQYLQAKGGNRLGGAFSSARETLSASSLALLANYRILDTQFFAGVVGAFGVLNSAKYKRPQPNGISRDVQNVEAAEKKSFYSIGVEGGSYVDQFLFGVEVGYQALKAHDWRMNIPGRPPGRLGIQEWDNSGAYVKVFIGTSFN